MPVLKFRPPTPDTPLPSGTEISWGRTISEYIPDWLPQSFDFLRDNFAYFLAGMLIILIIKIWINHLSISRKQVTKLWSFVLFFLSKRQMMIPMVVGLAQNHDVLSEEQLQKLLDIRAETKKYTLTHSPTERIAVELEVSNILLECFITLDQKGALAKSGKLRKVVEDLEFIDKKLVELQLLYNREADRWNKKIRRFFILRERVSPFKSFELFHLPE